MHLEQDVTLEAQNHRMLQTVRELATTFQATVVFLHVIQRAAEESGESVTHLQAVAVMEPLVAQAHELFGSSAEILKKSGDVITAISDTAKQLAADLIVVGRTRAAQQHVADGSLYRNSFGLGVSPADAFCKLWPIYHFCYRA